MAKVMLVEDDNNLREIYEARMQAEGYEIVTAKDGEEALVVAKAEKPDLIISDVMMPKISGFEMLDILRNTQGLKEVKVIMLTALGQSDDQLRADKLGADRYLVKSQVTLEDIVKAAHELIDGDAPATNIPAPVETAPETSSEPVEVHEAPQAAPVEAPEEGVHPPIVSPILDAQDTQSTAQEEAAIEAQIEDFVAGAAPLPTAPAATSPAADNSAAANDDKVMTEAVDNLMAKTDSTDAVSTDSGSKKVVEPLNSSQAPDINQLLAAEEAKSAAEQKPAAEPTSVPITVVAQEPPKSPAPPATDHPIDPNSIAL